MQLNNKHTYFKAAFLMLHLRFEIHIPAGFVETLYAEYKDANWGEEGLMHRHSLILANLHSLSRRKRECNMEADEMQSMCRVHVAEVETDSCKRADINIRNRQKTMHVRNSCI